ncbi:MAG: SGNH/GDSL hydrolase family protein [Clostridia bacterium]|nr:SGNH/GDSL hydrolase family protein [Clostridia bacterium]
MNWNEKIYNIDEKPLDNLVSGYSRTSVFRKIAFIGDSLSSGEFETCDNAGNKQYHDLYEYSWGQYIARKNGLIAYNFSRGGMTAREYMETFAEANDFFSKEKACQAYVIALGVNDLKNDNEIGSLSDINKEDYTKNKKTFLGYYGAIVSRYKKISPDAKFFFVTFPNEDQEPRKNLCKVFSETLQSLADFFENSYVIDLYKYGPVYDDEFKSQFYLHGHMNPSGYIFTAELVDSYIDFIVRHNPEDFKNVGFINSGIDY